MENKVFNSLIKYAKKDKILGLHISYYNNGNIYTYDYGHTNASKNVPINNQTLFEIGSITKPIIGTLFSILLQKNLVDLESPISLFFKPTDINPIFELITVKDIFTHTSGLPRIPNVLFEKMKDEEDPYSCLTQNDLYEFLKNPQELKEPGQYCYSNLGYGILGEILKIITSKSLREISKELLFDKIKMNNTDIIENIESSKNIATGHTFLDKETRYWHNHVLAGAGCFLSCGNDMLEFLIENINLQETALSESIHFTHHPITKKVGMAWHYKNSFLSKIIGYQGYIWHNGMTGGFSSFICFNKKKKVGLILLANKAIPLDSYFYNFSSYF